MSLESDWPLALSHDLAHVCEHWEECVTQAERTVGAWIQKVEREWHGIVGNPLFAIHGGVDSPESCRAYEVGRLAEMRRVLTPYLPQPDWQAVAELLDAEINRRCQDSRP